MKKCSRCGEEKPRTKYRFERPNRLSARCNQCRDFINSLWRRKNKGKVRAYMIKTRENIKQLVFGHYGKICVCCKETEMRFLVIDHIEGGGTKHRIRIGLKSGDPFYRWIVKNRFPKGFQVLCHNCNHAKRFGKCPHKTR